MQENIEQSESNSTQKKILIDTTFLFDQYSFRGIGKYGKEVVKRLIKHANEDNVEIYFAGFYDLKKNLIALGLSQFSVDQYLKVINFYTFGEPIDSSVGNIKRWNLTFKLAIEQIKPDVYFEVNFERGLPTAWIFKKDLKFIPKTVVMAHDAIPLATHSYSSKSFIHNILKGFFYRAMFSGVKNADLVLTNSNFSKDDLIKFGKVNADKITPIYLGIDERFFQEPSKESFNHAMKTFGVDKQKYFIYDSGLETNKGIFDLIKIFKNILDAKLDDVPTKLVLVGKDFTKAAGVSIKPKNERADRVLRELKQQGILHNVITTDRVSDEDLTVLIQEAYCYFNFSRYEGFSFGPLQAMAAKVRAVVGNYSCIPEVTEGAAFLVDSANTKKTSEDILLYLADKDLQNKLIAKGAAVAEKYNWDETAAKTWDKIKTVLA